MKAGIGSVSQLGRVHLCQLSAVGVGWMALPGLRTSASPRTRAKRFYSEGVAISRATKGRAVLKMHCQRLRRVGAGIASAAILIEL